MSNEPLTFGPFRLNPESGLLWRDGALAPIGQKGALILGRLLANPGEVATKAQLMDAAWPGIAVEESNLSVQIAALRKALGGAPGGGEWIVTVARVGYRLADASARANGPRPSLPLPDKPSIAVMPFQNMSGDPEQDYFADGIVDDIVVGLSRIKWLFVIARNSSFAYKGEATDVREVGRELGVRYVVMGGIRKAGGRVRITVQLIEAETATHIWAEKYDAALTDVFDLQDQITDRVVGIVEPSLQRSEIERSRRKRPENLDAYDLFLRAMPHVAAQMPDDIKTALPLLEEALRLEPNYAAAHAHLAWCYELRFTRGGLDEADKHAALRHAHATLTSGTDDATALAVAGFMICLLGVEHEAGLNAIDNALSLNASCATALYLGAQARALAAHKEKAAAYAHRALRLSPFDPLAFQAHMALGEIALLEDRYEESALCFGRAIQANAKFSTAYFSQAQSLALAGHMEEARLLAARGLELQPGFRFPIKLRIAPPLLEKLAVGARLLGLPE